ncbi:hypothetical protein HELRODRAFT_67216 [Helobdella robusta]|uniref:Phospholipase A-2-activating protein n=1 Tax=Helobdella robusta TaxID=6412 RepID=T1FYY2_HELRO|nr:hypothetical protein HELRODRAFT_67216 [Helobdella robusta]ESN99243.1 hypothetical protein HELRODRAFT_67216 [Helobdella robusta]
MSHKPYRLRCTLFGHEKDVRGLCSLYHPPSSFISVSRDITARVWVSDESTSMYREGMSMGGHENFISCVCTLPPDDEYPHGVILTGSNDHTINGYTIDSPAPVFKLTGHTNTVCALAAGKFGTFISGSWDNTAKVWFKQKNVLTLEGHEAAVWTVAVVPVSGHMITGSADKTIRIWKAGKVENVITGSHTDCIRCIVTLDPNHFASSSNDTTVRLWDMSGNCLNVLTGHTSFVYSIAFLSANFELVSGGEDRSIRIWKDGQCVQTIFHPAQSVWCVSVLANGDIVTGSSDGVVRMFTQEPSRMADDEMLNAYEQSITKCSLPAQIGDIKTDDLPGPDALNIPGKKEGQIQMIKRMDVVEAYQWSQSDDEWIKVGDVVGGGSNEQSDKKKDYEGKVLAFDYVAPSKRLLIISLKLPYNKNDDPYMAAHKFLDKNNLSPLFLDEVVQFIQQQTSSATLGEQIGNYVDPYTGASRYMAGTGETVAPSVGDPFTGSSRYLPGAAYQTSLPGLLRSCAQNDFSHSKPKSNVEDSVAYFPEKNFIKFEQINTQAMLSKLQEFNEQVDEDNKMKSHEFEQIKKLLSGGSFDVSSFFHAIDKMLFWPCGLLLPVLDILRFSFLDSSFNHHFFMNQMNSEPEMNIIYYAKSILVPNGLIKNQFMILRTLCNAFAHETGKHYIVQNIDLLQKNLFIVSETNDKSMQVALASLCVNLSVFYNTSQDDVQKTTLLSLIQELMMNVTDEEAYFRFAVAIGTIIKGNDVMLAAAKSLHFYDVLRNHTCPKNAKLDKTKRCYDALLSLLK